MIKVTEINRADFPDFIKSLSLWSENFDFFSLLNSNNYKDDLGKFELLAGVGAKRVIASNNVSELKHFHKKEPGWLFGHFSYDLKNSFEKLSSQHPVKIDFADFCFFEPLYLFQQAKNTHCINVLVNEGVEQAPVDEFVQMLSVHDLKQSKITFPKLTPKQKREDYIQSIKDLKAEIQYGNIYEINYCQEFFAEEVRLEPAILYEKLNRKSPMPFSAFYKNKTEYLLCASPERYLGKRGRKVYSQPIKGTAKREEDIEKDRESKEHLKRDLKEQTENVMIVDLVRNDLSRTAKKGSVKVEELFGVYTFPQVHQLISTISSELSEEFHFLELIEKSFPMGSMTGAPKISAMKLADVHEKSRRGLYSGSVGYITPEGDFDFNVVIRSLLYSSRSNYLSLMVGGAITIMSEPEKEYEECLLKAKAIFEL